MKNYYPQITESDSRYVDDDYVALLQVLSVALEIYSLEQSSDQKRQNNYIVRLLERIDDKLDKLENRINTIERSVERSVYNDR